MWWVIVFHMYCFVAIYVLAGNLTNNFQSNILNKKKFIPGNYHVRNTQILTFKRIFQRQNITLSIRRLSKVLRKCEHCLYCVAYTHKYNKSISWNVQWTGHWTVSHTSTYTLVHNISVQEQHEKHTHIHSFDTRRHTFIHWVLTWVKKMNFCPCAHVHSTTERKVTMSNV